MWFTRAKDNQPQLHGGLPPLPPPASFSVSEGDHRQQQQHQPASYPYAIPTSGYTASPTSYSFPPQSSHNAPSTGFANNGMTESLLPQSSLTASNAYELHPLSQQRPAAHRTDTNTTAETYNAGGLFGRHVDFRPHQSSESEVRRGSYVSHFSDSSDSDASKSDPKRGSRKKGRRRGRPFILKRTHWSFLIIHIIVVTALPILFLALAALVVKIHNKETDRWGDLVLRLIPLMPSVYPVVFTLLVGKAIHSIALYLAEKGTTLGRLEQLLGSTTLGGTVYTHLSLRIITGSGIVLLAVWSMSPLGGQAALRMVGRVNEGRVAPGGGGEVQLWYRSSDTKSPFEAPIAVRNIQTRLGAVFLSAVLAGKEARGRPLDGYGNVRVARIEDVERRYKETGQKVPPHNGWYEVDLGLYGDSKKGGLAKEPPAWASLLGIPIYDLPKEGRFSFPLLTSYYHLDCSPESPFKVDRTELPEKYLTPEDPDSPNANNVKFGFQMNVYTDTGEHMNSSWRNPRDDFENRNSEQVLTTPRKVVFAAPDFVSPTSDERTASIGICDITLTHIESYILCPTGAPSCRTTHVRRPAHLPQLPSTVTYLDGTNMATGFLFYFVESSGKIGRSSEATVVERFLQDPDTAGNQTSLEQTTLFNQPHDVFERRLELLMNTFWDTSLGTGPIMGVYPSYDIRNQTDIEFRVRIAETDADHPLGSLPEPIPGVGFPPPYVARITPPVKITLTVEIYRVDWKWWAIYVTATLVVFGMALAAVVVDYLTVVPDVFGNYVAWMLGRGGEWGWRGGNTDGVYNVCEVARRAKKLQVAVRDVKPGEEVGRVEFVALGMGKRKSKGRGGKGDGGYIGVQGEAGGGGGVGEEGGVVGERQYGKVEIGRKYM